jgi:NAD(P)-dependent dehydrogenase (short-subunit alcohol dehydrogenase family)
MGDEPFGTRQPVALVSGASRGIGLGLARALSRSGCRVAMLARSSSDLTRAAEELGDGAFPVTADVTTPTDVTRAIAQVEERWGPVELLVHNAGSTNVIGPLWEADPNAWWDEVAVHLRGAMLLAHACLPSMIERRTGRVVLVYGNLGDSGSPWCTAFAAGKAGLLRLVDQLHAELEGTGVRVFGLHPGLVWTPMTEVLAEDADKRRWLPNFGQRPRDDYGTSEPAGEMLVQVAAGDADQLSGLLLGVWDDLGALSGQVDELRAEQRRALRVR